MTETLLKPSNLIRELAEDRKQAYYRITLKRELININDLENNKFLKQKDDKDPSGVKYILTPEPSKILSVYDSGSGVFEISVIGNQAFDIDSLNVVRDIVTSFYPQYQFGAGVSFICFRFAPDISDFENFYATVFTPFSMLMRPTINFQHSVSSGVFYKPNKAYHFEVVYRTSPTNFLIEMYCGINIENSNPIDSTFREMYVDLYNEVNNMFDKIATILDKEV